METITEWEFTADVASWINEILSKDSRLPFLRAKCEQRGSGSRKRRDLTLLDKAGNVVLTGEVKLPDRRDGGSPHNGAVVRDARTKAIRAKAPYFFTWNVNECVLWETSKGASWKDREFKAWSVTNIVDSRHLHHPSVQHEIQTWLPLFLKELAETLRGESPIGHKSPDEKFIAALESALRIPITLNVLELSKRYPSKPRFRAELDQWMRVDQGWTIYDDPVGMRENVERASKFSCYALVNKLVFYEALLKRYGVTLAKLAVPKHVDTGDGLRRHLERYFADAKDATRDYETVFGEDHTGIGSRIPFYAEGAVPHWRELIGQIHEFDFSKLDYEIIGTMCERLNSPEERHKYGQYYTRVEVVDLINSFCIRRGDERLLDPSCGGGTFLVRAYVRKRELAPDRSHGKLLSDLYGVDVSHFATHLTTINLATRDLIDAENYPQIVRSDFFDVEPTKTFVTLPRRTTARGLGRLQHRDITIEPLDAVAGNPPYVRQEDIPSSPPGPHPKRGTKQFYQQLIQQEAHLRLSGRSDLHCYFWPHATTFLRDDGHLCFVTSSQWLDVEYGFGLQRWMLENFQIVAVFESVDEPWFVGARVATAVTILKRQRNEDRRMDNVVRFVQLRQPMRDILDHDGTTAGAVVAADRFRDRIMSLAHDTVAWGFRARLIRQRDLWAEGVRLGKIMARASERNEGDEGDSPYFGGKWGIFLRAPDLWFDLTDKYGATLVPLGDVADVRFGVKTGKDVFFFPKGISTDCLQTEREPAAFEEEYGVPRREVESGRVRLVECGEGYRDIRPIEAKYLEPEIHSLMEIDRFSAEPEGSSRLILLVPQKKERLRGTYVLEYIRWGEKQGFHEGSTVAARATAKREWYDLTANARPDIILPKIQQYRLITFLNSHRLYQNSSLLGIYGVPTEFVKPLCGVLNSTVAILSRLQYARILGNEANIQLDVYAARMMRVPDLRKAEPDAVKAIAAAFDKMLQRPVLAFLSERRLREMSYAEAGREAELNGVSSISELEMEDRNELDQAVLWAIGVPARDRRHVLSTLYDYMRGHFEYARRKEEKAIRNKSAARQRGPVTAKELAMNVYEELAENHGHLLRRYDPDFIDRSRPADTFDLPLHGEPVEKPNLFASFAVEFRRGSKTVQIVEARSAAQVSLIALVAKSGVRGLVRIPHDQEECKRVLERYRTFLDARSRVVTELIEARTTDEEMQARVASLLPSMLAKGDHQITAVDEVVG